MNKMISSISNYINAIPKKSTFTLMSILLAVSNSVFAADCKTSMSYVKVVSDIPPTLKINPNVPIGGVMASGTYRTGSGPLPNGCTMYGPTTGYLTGVGTPNGNVYPTNLPYVGYKIMALGGNYISSKFYNKYWPITVSTPEPYLVIGTVQSFNFKFELIKLGTITADTPLFFLYWGITELRIDTALLTLWSSRIKLRFSLSQKALPVPCYNQQFQ